jgi:DNA-binding SARP family transcriptional activator
LLNDERSYSLRLLNGFDLRCEGEPLPVPIPGQRVLAFLALQQGAVLRSYVAGSLWIDSNDEHAAASLRSALWRIRHDGYKIVESTSRLLLLASAVTVDVRNAVDWARRIEDPHAEVERRDIEWATSFGDLLPDWYDDWLVVERERIRQLGLHALELLCRRLTQEQRFGHALDVGLAAVRCEPLRESAHRVVIEVHLAEGNPTEAVRHYALCSRLLHDRLGLDPSERLQELVRPLHARITVR